jgi:hypothetical protein
MVHPRKPICALATLAFLVTTASASGPLRVLKSNPRYFTDDSGKAIYLTGSHTWNNFLEITRPPANPNPVVDFSNYLEFLKSHHHNFFRLWTWESPAEMNVSGGVNYRYSPLPFERPGPGVAMDGGAKFDLRLFNSAYFGRMRQRVVAARDKGMYVSIMLFQGFSLNNKGHDDPWPAHPFNARNNINGIDGDPNHSGGGLSTHALSIPAITALQEAYIRRVIDEVNDLDNVLYEITNEDEGGTQNTAWQVHMIQFIKSYEAGKTYQHPVGMTAQYPKGSNVALFSSGADWISPNDADGYQTEPPAADGRKVIINDTDHSFYYLSLQKVGLTAQRVWVWKNFTRGNQVLFMDPYLDPTPWDMTDRNHPSGDTPDPYWDILRSAMGDARLYAERMDLAAMIPQNALSSTGYCLANPGREYLVYQPEAGTFTVNLQAGDYHYEWFSPINHTVISTGSFTAAAGSRSFTAPLNSEAVLYLKSAITAPRTGDSGLAGPAVLSGLVGGWRDEHGGALPAAETASVAYPQAGTHRCRPGR